MPHRHYASTAQSLQHKIILVTGATAGIGRVAARYYAQCGATVVLQGRNESKLQQVVDEIYTSTGQQADYVILDLMTANEHDYQQFAQRILQCYGRLDGVLHNAGVLGERVPLAQYSLSVWQEVMQVNVTAVLALTQVLLPVLSHSSLASVVFTSSGVGRAVREDWGAYSISKIVIEAMNQLFSLENTSLNVRFNCINPGATRTAMRANAFPNEDPLQLPTAEQLMPTYIYLMSDDSRHLQGQSINAQ